MRRLHCCAALLCLAALSSAQPHALRQRGHASWYKRLSDWWPWHQQDHAPGYKWDAYLPRTSAAFSQELAETAAALDRAYPDAALYSPDASLADWDGDAEDWPAPGAAWTSRNSSELTPVISLEVMWLLQAAEDRLRNASGVPFALQTARRLAAYNSVAYCQQQNIDAWNCTRCRGPVAGMKVGRTIYDEAWDLFGYTGYSPTMKAVIVAFRGTDSHSISNWVENMHYWKTDYQVPFPGAEGAAVHTGFFISYNNSALQPNVTASVAALLSAHPGASLYVIGHSMGAAMAHVCALDLKFRFQLPRERVFLYTFGSPRVGNDVFAKFLRNQVQGSIRVTHNRDIVPTWPPMWVGFHHVATEVWQVDIDSTHVLGICDTTGEDPLCHNSVCFLGLCTSIADHLLYLGAKMYHRPEAPC